MQQAAHKRNSQCPARLACIAWAATVCWLLYAALHKGLLRDHPPA